MIVAKQVAEVAVKALLKASSIETPGLTTMEKHKSIETLASFLGVNLCGDPFLIEMVGTISQWIKRIKSGDDPSMLSLLGNSETGKTHCAKRLAKWLYARPEWEQTSFIPSLIYWPRLIDEMRDGDFRLYRDIQSWPYLVVDDIFAERDPTGFAADKLNTLLGARARFWTLTTGNVTFDRIAEIDERIASRLVRNNGMVVECLAIPYSTR